MNQEVIMTVSVEKALLKLNVNFVLESFLVGDLVPECTASVCSLKRNGADYIKVRILDPRKIQLYDGPKHAHSGNHHTAGEAILDGTYLYNPPVIEMR